MYIFDWNEEKNDWLKHERGVSFEEVVAAVYSGDLLDDRAHHNRQRYPHQYLLVVRLNNYVYVVPYVIGNSAYFLKTVIPSRKYARACPKTPSSPKDPLKASENGAASPSRSRSSVERLRSRSQLLSAG